jgi:cytochrome c oxidase assembly protein subunit 15
MRSLRRLCIASTVATVVLVAIGGLVRATKSGLGCGTDWPHCSGKLVPSVASRAAVIEYSHRVAACIVVVLLASLAAVAWRHRSLWPRLWRASLTAFALVLVQALLGALVVKLELETLSVVLHLATAMALVGVLVYVTAVTGRSADLAEPVPDRSAAMQASVAAGFVFALLLVGSYVSSTPGAGRAFGDWPLMNGTLLPDLALRANALHFLHRILAALTGVVVGATAWGLIRRKSTLALQARLAQVAMGTFAVEVIVGALAVWTRLNAIAVTAHLFLGTLVWASLVAIVVVSRPPITEEATATTSVPRSSPALERAR